MKSSCFPINNFGRIFAITAATFIFQTPAFSASIGPILAQAGAGGGTAQLKEGFQLALGIMFMFGFIWGVIKIWSGANAISKGDPDGKAGIVAGIIIAGAAAIMGALFAIFGLSGGALTPTF